MLFINGAWRDGQGESFQSIDPAASETVWEGRAASPADVEAAFTAARQAFPAWARLPLEKRMAIVERYRDGLEKAKPELARLISRETGKPRWEATGELGAMIGKVAISEKAYSARTGANQSGADFGYVRMAHKPLGVMFVLGPYNFPGHLPNGHIVPALIAGNTVVFKPSEITPGVGEAMVKIWEEAGLPKGVLNLVQGARETGAAALDSAELDGVLFTGSWPTGRFIHEKFAGRTGVQLALEMGGNNPLVIWDVDDAEAAARLAIHSAFLTAGQRCSCARRLILPDGPAGEAVTTRLVELAGRLSVGAWDSDPEPFMGPLVSERAAQAVLKAQADLLARGARPLRLAEQLEAGPAFVSPGVVDVTDISVADEEIFGPLLQVTRVDSFDAAIAAANKTAFGLSAGLVSDSGDLWDRFWTESRAGIVNWNRPTVGAASNMPFGGPGQSGNLRPSAYYAADYCAYPVASQASETPERLPIRGVD